MVKAKYQDVLDLGEKLNIQNGDVSEKDGVLQVKGTAATQYEKNSVPGFSTIGLAVGFIFVFIQRKNSMK